MIQNNKQTNDQEQLQLICLQTNTATESIVDLAAMRNDKMPVLGELLRYKGGHIPGMPGYKWALDRGEGLATYDVRDGRTKILSGVVAWDARAEDVAWDIAQKSAKEVGMIPIMIANDDMKIETLCRPEKPESLPWMASSLCNGALRPPRGHNSPVFSLGYKSDGGLVMTAPVVAATTRSLLDLANFEMLLSCAILAKVQTEQLG